MTEGAPTTPAAMYDVLHEWFGVGSYDDLTNTGPWHRARMVEISKLKAMMRSRRVTLVEVWTAANYARDRRKPIHSTWEVFALIPEANKARFRQAAVDRRDDTRIELSDAIDEAVAAGEHEWAERLLRADDHTQAIKEWRSRG